MKKGFTLIELIMVIALIAIVSTLAVSKIGDLRQRAQRQISLSSQQAVGRAVDVFQTVNNGKIDRLDSLLDKDVPDQAASSAGFYDPQGTSLSAAPGQAGFYFGRDDKGSPLPEVFAELNSGLTPRVANAAQVPNHVLVPYALSKAECNALNNWGFKYVMRHVTDATQLTADSRGEDGSYLLTGNDDAEAILNDAHMSGRYALSVTGHVGMVVAAVSPFTPFGREIYRDCGQQLLATKKTPAEYRGDSAAVIDEVKATGGALLAFGLGPHASLIGSSAGGLETVPYATYPAPKFYRQYILLLRVDTKNPAGKVEFAGVLDPCGNTIRAARAAL